MSVHFCVLLWAREGRVDDLVAYEDAVLALVPDHGGAVTSRVRSDGSDGHPHEVQLYEFPDEASVRSYLDDPRRRALADRRDAAVERTELFEVEPVV